MYAFFLFLSLLFWGDDLTRLGDDSFRVREQASQLLEKCAPFSYMVVEKGLRSTDLEVRRRCMFLEERIMVQLKPVYDVYLCYEAYMMLHGGGPDELSGKQRDMICRETVEFHKAIFTIASRNPKCSTLYWPCDSEGDYSGDDMAICVYQARRIMRGKDPYDP